MKWRYISFFIVMIGIGNACSMEQEFIMTTKTKKKYVSEQQDLEMDGYVITSGTNATQALADLLKTVSLITKNSLNRINDHMDGEKNSLNKIERTERYNIKKKIRQKLDSFIGEIEKEQQCLNDFMVLLDQKIQSE
jgi:hypothetical protein